MHLGRIMGVNLRVHYLFLLPLLLWALTGHWGEGALAFLAVFLHELGHLTVARRLGFTPEKVELLPFGGVLGVQENLGLEPEAEKRIALAGPWTNLVLIGGLTLLRGYFPQTLLLRRFLEANMGLVFFNLLPVLPFDGGRVYRANLVTKYGFKAGTIRAVRLSRYAGFLFLILGSLLLFKNPYGLNLVIMAGFLYFSSRRMMADTGLLMMAFLSGKQRELAKRGTMATTLLVADSEAELGDLLEHFAPRHYHLVYVLGEGGKVLGLVSEEEVLSAILRQGLEARVYPLLK